ncbi:MAG: DUF4832 domain-containing protein [Christensenellales bacterium]|jgi:hypothetical protein
MAIIRSLLRALAWIAFFLIAIFLALWLKMPRYASASYLRAERTLPRPLCGVAVDARCDPDTVSSDITLCYVRLSWHDFEPMENEFAFDWFDEEFHVEAWRQKGVKMILRFLCDIPSNEKHADIPDYLIEWLGEFAGRDYDDAFGKGFAPNYSAVPLQKRHFAVLSALADRYDFAFVELGSLGRNGEWAFGDDTLPLLSDAKIFLWQYTQIFPVQRLLLASPLRQARKLDCGLYLAHLEDSEATWRNLTRIEDGGYDERFGQISPPMPASFRGASTLTGSVPLETLSAAKLTYLCVEDGEFAHPSLLGYSFWVSDASWSESVRRGSSLRFSCTFNNGGVAAFCENWPLVLSLMDDAGNILTSSACEANLAHLRQGAHPIRAYLDVPHAVPKGEYRLALSIVDPATGEAAIELCMDGEKEGLCSILGRMTVR